MAKQLVIDIKAVDQLSAPVRGMVANMLLMGDASIKAEKESGGAFKRMMGSVLSVKGAFVGLVGTITAGLGARALFQSFSSAAKEMDEIGDAAIRLGMGVEELSSLKYTADLANISFQALGDGIFTAQKNIGMFMVIGGGKAAPALRLLNVQLTDSAGRVREMTELLPEFVDALRAVPDTTTRNFLTAKIFGDGPEFIRLLAEGGDRLRSFNREARALGVVFTPAQIAIANEFRDSIDRIRNAWFGLKAVLVVRFGPLLTEQLNELSGVIAAVPAMIGTLFTAVRDALGSGPGREEARARFRAFFGDLGRLAWVGLKGVGLVVLAGGITLGQAIVTQIFTNLTRMVGQEVDKLIIGAMRMMGAGLALARAVHPETSKLLAGLFPVTSSMVDSIESQLLSAGQTAEGAHESVERMTRTMEEDLYPTVIGVMTGIRAELGLATGDLLASTDAILGWGEALARTSIAKLPRRPEQGKTSAPPKDLTREWTKGLTQGLDDFRLKAEQTFELGRAMATTFADTLTDGLTVAIVDVAGGVRSLKDAFKDLGSSTLRMLSEMIVKFLLLRAVSGIAGAFTGGGLGGRGGQALGLPTEPVLNAGGILARSGVQRFAGGGVAGDGGSGGMAAVLTPGEVLISPAGVRANRDVLAQINMGARVGRVAPLAMAAMMGLAAPLVMDRPLAWGLPVPGPDVNRDIIPAVLPFGTGVISRRGVEANDPATLAYMARGGKVALAGTEARRHAGTKGVGFNAGGVAGDLASVMRAPVGSGRMTAAGGGSLGAVGGGMGGGGPVSITVSPQIHLTVQGGGGAMSAGAMEAIKKGITEATVEALVRAVEMRAPVRDRLKAGLG